MPTKWESPIYNISYQGKPLTIDVSGSVSESLPAKKTIKTLLPFCEKHEVRTILDFGAGVLRHTIPLVEAGFEVYAVDFEEQTRKPSYKKSFELIKHNPNFKPLIFPKDFINNKTRFDMVLLCYVLQIMPFDEDRKLVLDSIIRKMKHRSYLLYMSQLKQITEKISENPFKDGYLKGMKYSKKTFYREFSYTETLQMFESRGLIRKHSYGEKGQEQVYLFSKGGAEWP